MGKPISSGGKDVAITVGATTEMILRPMPSMTRPESKVVAETAMPPRRQPKAVQAKPIVPISLAPIRWRNTAVGRDNRIPVRAKTDMNQPVSVALTVKVCINSAITGGTLYWLNTTIRLAKYIITKRDHFFFMV